MQEGFLELLFDNDLLKHCICHRCCFLDYLLFAEILSGGAAKHVLKTCCMAVNVCFPGRMLKGGDFLKEGFGMFTMMYFVAVVELTRLRCESGIEGCGLLNSDYRHLVIIPCD